MCDEYDKCKGKNLKIVHFGEKGSPDYTTHGDPKKRDNYLRRHEANEDWSQPDTPGALSRWLLWGNSRSFDINLGNFTKRFGLRP